MSRIWYVQASFTLVNQKTLKREVPSFYRFPEPQSLLGSKIHCASLKDRNVLRRQRPLRVLRLSEKKKNRNETNIISFIYK